jgi:hypothetical protein
VLHENKNDARYIFEIKSAIATAKAAFNRKKTPFTGKLRLNLRKKIIEYNIWNIVSCGAEILIFRKADQKKF